MGTENDTVDPSDAGPLAAPVRRMGFAPGQIVIGGDTEAVDRAIALLTERGVRKVVKLAVSVPSHTPLMREAANRLADVMALREALNNVRPQLDTAATRLNPLLMAGGAVNNPTLPSSANNDSRH